MHCDCVPRLIVKTRNESSSPHNVTVVSVLTRSTVLGGRKVHGGGKWAGGQTAGVITDMDKVAELAGGR